MHLPTFFENRALKKRRSLSRKDMILYFVSWTLMQYKKKVSYLIFLVFAKRYQKQFVQ
jgi:hypothetical protein